MSLVTCLICGALFEAHRTFCANCWTTGWIVDVGTRRCADVDVEPEVTSAREIVSMTYATVESRRYPELRFGLGCFVLVTGYAGAGKSSLECGILDGIVGRPVVLVSIEEPPGPSMADRLLRLGIKRDDFHVVGRASVDQVVALLRKTKAVALGIDSIQRAVSRLAKFAIF
jgi:predicted ATP-dependent serine protease